MTMAPAELAAFLDSRCGKLTGSRMAAAMSFKKDGSPSAERDRLLKELLVERVTGISFRRYVTPAMEWGTLMEPEAKMAYEVATGNICIPCGYYDHPSIDMLGATPDALIAPDGLAEFKAPTTVTHIEYVLSGVVPPAYVPQMSLQLLCTGRRFCDFASYDPRIREPSRRLFIRRFEPTADELAVVEQAAVRFLADLEDAFERFSTSEVA